MWQMKRMKVVSIKFYKNVQLSSEVVQTSMTYKMKTLSAQVEVEPNNRALMRIVSHLWSRRMQLKKKKNKTWNKQAVGVANSSIKNFTQMKARTIYLRIQMSFMRTMKRIKPLSLWQVKFNGEPQLTSRLVQLKSWVSKNCIVKFNRIMIKVRTALQMDIVQVCLSKQSHWCQCNLASWTAAPSEWSNLDKCK